MHNLIESPTEVGTARRDILQQIQTEFLDMPGLRLTLAQAQRLWTLEPSLCESLLRVLIDNRVLLRTSDGMLVRRES